MSGATAPPPGVRHETVKNADSRQLVFTPRNDTRCSRRYARSGSALAGVGRAEQDADGRGSFAAAERPMSDRLLRFGLNESPPLIADGEHDNSHDDHREGEELSMEKDARIKPRWASGSRTKAGSLLDFVL